LTGSASHPQHRNIMVEQLLSFFATFADAVLDTMRTAIALGIVFTLLSVLFTPCNKGFSWWRRTDLPTDLAYFFVMPLFGRFAVIFFVIVAAGLLQGVGFDNPAELIGVGRGPLASTPFWLQVALYLVIQDLLMYWSHRAFHTARLWRYHAVHHSSEHLDWLSGRRFHPIDFALHSAFPDAVCLMLGISPEVFIFLAPFNVWHSALVHANLNWSFGPFRYVLASPVFHRWHHTDMERGGMKNFAATFPALDLIFGTFYMPNNAMPDNFGVEDKNFPKSFGGQLIYPFINTQPPITNEPHPSPAHVP
jgi:sterol desaturase/sphingolipid hydroxylase (fatty acid hydroxylase superfamily)